MCTFPRVPYASEAFFPDGGDGQAAPSSSGFEAGPSDVMYGMPEADEYEGGGAPYDDMSQVRFYMHEYPVGLRLVGDGGVDVDREVQKKSEDRETKRNGGEGERMRATAVLWPFRHASRSACVRA